MLVAHLHRPVWLRLRHSDLSVHIRLAVRVQAVLDVKVPELAYDYVLPHVFGELFPVGPVPRVQLLDPLDVVQIRQLLRLLIDHLEDLLQVLHVLEDESLGLVQHQVLYRGEEVEIDFVLFQGILIFLLPGQSPQTEGRGD